ncbi:UvrD-helicase domain-containing protein [Salibacterium sp. K-3]
MDKLKGEKEPIADNCITTLCDTYEEALLQGPSVPEFYSSRHNSSAYQELVEKREKLISVIRSLIEELPLIQEERNKVIYFHLQHAKEFLRQVDQLRSSYITHSIMKSLKNNLAQEAYDFFYPDWQQLSEASIHQFLDMYYHLSSRTAEWNKEYVEAELKNNKHFFNDIDGKSLDDQQRLAIVTDEDSNLILAGAGSGKTLTISGKVKYLIEQKGVRPEEILLISFTRKAAGEMRDRIADKLNVDIDVKTFHKLGLEIISNTQQKKPTIDNSMNDTIQSFLETQLYYHKNYLQLLMMFFGQYIKIPKGIEDFDSLGEYHEYHKNLDLETLKSKAHKQEEFMEENTARLAAESRTYQGEIVKSTEEFLLANFLYLNGISYTYEKPYAILTADEKHRQYMPDFYLDDYDIYLEHFGVNEHGRAPHLSPVEEKRYLNEMNWKRQIHQEHGTTLLETYSYYNRQGILLQQLEHMLQNEGVEFQPIDSETLFSRIYDHIHNTYLLDFKKLIGSFITLFKSKGYQYEDFHRLEKENQQTRSPFFKKRNKVFFALIKPIYRYYEEHLQQNNAIDFNDMINRATTVVKNTGISFPYKYIIVDEYQDISQSRFHLIDAIRRKTNARVMCVGDDWQSIFRFAGSDLELFTNFGKYFGYHELLRIEKTYRNSQQLIDTAGSFVVQNPEQYKKNLTSDKTHDFPIRLCLFNQHQITKRLKEILDEIADGTDSKDSTIMLLGRNNYDVKILEKSPDFTLKNNNSTVVYKRHPGLTIEFMSVHKSKGLEADYVILLNAKNGKTGFPNKMEDDPLLEWVLQTSNTYLFSEERRLFYTALTRTENVTYILVPEKSPSTFVKELNEDYNISYETNHYTPREQALKCPRCRTGELMVRKNSFVGCSNYPQCHYTINDTSVLNHQKRCKSCGGFMVIRKNQKGESFYGCSNFPLCGRSENMQETAAAYEEN